MKANFFTSTNALVSGITIVLGLILSLFRENGLNIPPDAAEQIVNAVAGLDIVQIVSVIFPSILLPVWKFAKNGWPSLIGTFKQSQNFRTQMAIGIVGLIALSGLTLGVEAVLAFLDKVSVVSSLSAGTVISLLAALLHAINSAYYLNKK